MDQPLFFVDSNLNATPNAHADAPPTALLWAQGFVHTEILILDFS